jgi:hypothetical protein
MPLTEFAYGRSTHAYTLVEELGSLALLQGRLDAFRNPVEGRNWTREAVKRVGASRGVGHHERFEQRLKQDREAEARKGEALGPTCEVTFYSRRRSRFVARSTARRSSALLV